MMVWFLVALIAYLLILLAVVWFSLHPVRIPIFLSPGSLGAPQEEVEFDCESLKLRGWWVEAENAKAVMIFPHGYLMNRAELTPAAFLLWQRGVSCLLFDFRAHGRSQGKKSFLGYREAADVRAAVAYARQRAPGAKIGLMGSSMGSAASAIACGDDPNLADVLVLDSCYGRMSGAVLGWWRFLGGKYLMYFMAPSSVLAIPMAGFNPFQIDVSRALAAAGPLPVLHLHGERDDLALPEEARRNHAACEGPSELVFFPGCGHSEGRWVHPEMFQRSLFGFLERHDFLEPLNDSTPLTR